VVGTAEAGVIYSFDGGANWKKLPGSEKMTMVSGSCSNELRNNTLYVASYGRDIFTVLGLWNPQDFTWDGRPICVAQSFYRADLRLPMDGAVHTDRTYSCRELRLFRGASLVSPT